MAYIDGFLVPVPTANKDAYRKAAAGMVAMVKEFGVTRHAEFWGDDVPEGKQTDMRRAVKATPDETVAFSWFEYPDKATRDSAGQKMRTDPRMEDMGKDMPFDGMRMIFGGFEVVADTGPTARPAYIDGSVVPALKGSKAAYLAWSARMAKRLMELGATRCVEAWSDDVPDGKVTDFRRAVAAEPGEAIVFSWIEWPSKATRDAAWPQLMEDFLMPSETELRRVDNQRRIHGGFAPIVDE